MENYPYKAVLFELIQYLAHSQEQAAKKAFEWLEIVREAAHRHGNEALSEAANDAVRHLTLQQARRQMDRLSGRDDG